MLVLAVTVKGVRWVSDCTDEYQMLVAASTSCMT